MTGLVSRGTSVKVICYIAHEEKRFCVQINENNSARERGVAMLPVQRFWRETFFVVRCHVTSK